MCKFTNWTLYGSHDPFVKVFVDAEQLDTRTMRTLVEREETAEEPLVLNNKKRAEAWMVECEQKRIDCNCRAFDKNPYQCNHSMQ